MTTAALFRRSFAILILLSFAASFSSQAFGHGREGPRPPAPGYGHRPGPGGPPGHGGLRPGRPGRGRPPEHRRRNPIARPNPKLNDEIDMAAARLFDDEIRELRCERLGESLVRLSNRMTGMREWVKDPRKERLPPPGWRPGLPQQERDVLRRRWDGYIKNRAWWDRLWTHVLEAYRSCEVECFDDGEIIGQISAAGYCGMSIGLEGLDAPGRIAQTPLPVCETATFAGCVAAYRATAKEYEGCSTYMGGRHADTFSQFISQDCHVE